MLVKINYIENPSCCKGVHAEYFTFPTPTVDQGSQPLIGTMLIDCPKGKEGRGSLILLRVETVEALKARGGKSFLRGRDCFL